MSSLVSFDSSNLLLGYYGKVPTHGDFVGKGLPRQFLSPWDAWVQEMMHFSRQQLGNEWMQHFLTCPLYRFALSPGLCGSQAWLGVMIPSVDQVGRYYPMTLCRSVASSEHLLDAFKHYQDWYEQAEQLILSCLADDFVLTQFEASLKLMEQELLNLPTPEEPTTLQRLVHKVPNAAWRVGLMDPKDIKSTFPSLLQVMLSDFCLAYSLWFTQGVEGGNPSLLVAKGLPPFQGVTAMLDGQWQQWGWIAEQRMNA